MDIRFKLKKGDRIELEDFATVIQDNGDKVDFRWDNGDVNWVWKVNIGKVYRNGELVYGSFTTFVNSLEKYDSL